MIKVKIIHINHTFESMDQFLMKLTPETLDQQAHANPMSERNPLLRWQEGVINDKKEIFAFDYMSD